MNLFFSSFQSEIVKRLSAIVGQVLPFLSQEHQQQVATAVERAKQVTMSELNSVIGVSSHEKGSLPVGEIHWKSTILPGQLAIYHVGSRLLSSAGFLKPSDLW